MRSVFGVGKRHTQGTPTRAYPPLRRYLAKDLNLTPCYEIPLSALLLSIIRIDLNKLNLLNLKNTNLLSSSPMETMKTADAKGCSRRILRQDRKTLRLKERRHPLVEPLPATALPQEWHFRCVWSESIFKRTASEHRPNRLSGPVPACRRASRLLCPVGSAARTSLVRSEWPGPSGRWFACARRPYSRPSPAS